MYELWIGTPNEMRKKSAGTLGAVTALGRSELKKRRREADVFESSSIGLVVEAIDGLNALTPSMFMAKDAVRSWQFPFMGINYRIEVRKP